MDLLVSNQTAGMAQDVLRSRMKRFLAKTSCRSTVFVFSKTIFAYSQSSQALENGKTKLTYSILVLIPIMWVDSRMKIIFGIDHRFGGPAETEGQVPGNKSIS